MSYTSGPWKYPSGNRISVIETNAPGLFPVVVARVFDQSDPAKYGDEISNAKLIAAAPELLQALKSLIQSLPDDPDSYEDSALYRQIKDAVNKGKNIITKATGENYA